jgi:EAL domain-containing protein (putative c-di-GMP-specific phosphodiesterase class I)
MLDGWKGVDGYAVTLYPPNAVGPPAMQGPDRAAIERIAVEPDRLRAVYQPIVDLERGVICGFEALARFQKWNPGAWFAHAAKIGLAGPLEAAVVHSVLGNRSRLPDGCFLSLNVTPHGLLDTMVQNAFRSYGGLDGIVVEVAGQIKPGTYPDVEESLAEVRGRGARVGVDVTVDHTDFNQLILLRPDFVKIDRTLVAGLDGDRRKASVVGAMARLAADLGARAVAEGIETEGELEAAIDLRVPFGQGFAFGHGVPVMSGHALRLESFIRDRASAGP